MYRSTASTPFARPDAPTIVCWSCSCCKWILHQSVAAGKMLPCLKVLWFSLVSPGKCRNSTPIKPLPFLYKYTSESKTM
jgi:hypothetical protein